jgi:hypothetical protein
LTTHGHFGRLIEDQKSEREAGVHNNPKRKQHKQQTASSVQFPFNLSRTDPGLATYYFYHTTMALSTAYRILFLIIGLFCVIVVAQEEANPETPPNRYYVGTPDFRQERLDLFLRYPVSDFVPYRNLDWTIFDGVGCADSNEISTYQEYLSIDMIYAPESESPEGDGTAFRNVTLSFTFNPDTIRASEIIHEQDLETYLEFCVRLGANTADRINPGAVEVFYAETFVRLKILQNGDFDVEESVTIRPERIGEQRERQDYFLIGFLCNATNHEIVDPEPIYQGQIHRVCVTPTADALKAGVYMRAIDSFSWTRQDIYQPAILPPAKPAALTEVECEPGMEICAFETLFKAAFFYKLGRIDGMGIGWLQVRVLEYEHERGSQRLYLFSRNYSFILCIVSLEEDHMSQLVGPRLLLVSFK